MSSTRYIIEGNTIRKEELTSTQMVSLEGLLPHLTSYIPLELSPLPNNCRFIKVKPLEENAIDAQIIVTHDPMFQRVNYKDGNARSSRAARNYRINIPYGIFWFHLRAQRINTPLSSSMIWTPQQWGYLWSNVPFATITTTPVWPAAMPNCWSNGTVCFGSTNVTANQALGHFIDAAINTFWLSEFNNDLSVSVPHGSLPAWETASTTVDSWNGWPMWDGQGETLKQKLDRIEATNWSEPFYSSVDSPIPGLRILPTFYNLQSWLEELSETDRERLRAAINA